MEHLPPGSGRRALSDGLGTLRSNRRLSMSSGVPVTPKAKNSLCDVTGVKPRVIARVFHLRPMPVGPARVPAVTPCSRQPNRCACVKLPPRGPATCPITQLHKCGHMAIRKAFRNAPNGHQSEHYNATFYRRNITHSFPLLWPRIRGPCNCWLSIRPQCGCHRWFSG